MTTDEVKTVAKKYRKAALIGGLLGLLVLVGWSGYVIAVTPAIPTIQTASAPEVVSFIADSRGLAKLSRAEQRQFLERWQEHVARPDPREALKGCFAGLGEKDRKRFTDAIFRHLKRVFLEDARRFASLTSVAEKSAFLRKKVDEMQAQSLFIKDVASVMSSDFGGRDELTAYLLDHTTAKERLEGEPYGEALKRVAFQLRKEQRAGGKTTG